MPNNRRLLPNPEAVHGRVETFRAGCRCKACDKIAREYATARHLDHHDGKGRVLRVLASQPSSRPVGVKPGIGSARRLRALVTLGYPPNRLALRLGLLSSEVLDLLYLPRSGTIQVWKAENIAALYDELWDQPRHDDAAQRSQIVARREGWLPPLAWDDDLIDEPNGQPNIRTFGGYELPGQGPYFLPFSELEFLFNQGTPLAEILARGGYDDVKSLKKRLQTHGRRDLLAMIPDHQEDYASKRAGVPA